MNHDRYFIYFFTLPAHVLPLTATIFPLYCLYILTKLVYFGRYSIITLSLQPSCSFIIPVYIIELPQ